MATVYPMNVVAGGLALVNVLALVGILASPLLYFASIFFFDSPASSNNPLLWGAVLGIWSYPVTAGLGGIMGLKAWKAGNVRPLVLWTLCSISSPALFGICWLLLSLLCNGQFACSRH